MKTLNIIFFGDYFAEERVLKKSKTLSQYFKIKVIAITSKFENKILKVNDNLIIENIYINPKLKILYKTIFNNYLLSKIVKKNPAEIYECHDPVTIFAGICAKNKFNSKIIYDSHELWVGVGSKQENIFKTIYSKILGKIMFLLEKKYIQNFDNVIVVNKSICEIYAKLYNLKKIDYIYNYSNFDEFNGCTNKKESIVFIGKNRPFVEDKLTLAKKLKLSPVVMGFKGKYKDIEYMGLLTKEEYTRELRKQKIGLNFYSADSKSLYYSLPNKLFQYIQAEVPIISADLPEQKFIKKEGFGEFFNGSDEDFLNKLELMLNKDNYSKYIKNLKTKKYKYSWENQKNKLIKIYRSLC